MAETAKIKSWKTFQSKLGFEFKYPDCWKVEIDDPDEKGPTESSKNIFVGEKKECERPPFAPDVPNGIGFGAGNLFETQQEALDYITKRKSSSIARVADKTYLIFKDLSNISKENMAYLAYVEVLPYNQFRWRMNLYCQSLLSVSITATDIKNPDPSYYEKFKKGDLALPEPEKTILESVRCIPPKVKSKAQSPTPAK